MATSKVVRGYHGTTQTAAQNILKGNFDRTKRPASWLGTGRYFFQDGPTHAQAWADMTAALPRRRHEGGPAVVAVDIDLTLCLDLADSAFWPFLKQVADHRGKLPQSQLGPLSIYLDSSIHDKAKLGWNYEDCIVMNAAINSLRRYYQTVGGDITTVRAPFIEGQPLHQNSWLFSKACIMLSVLEPSAFVSPFQLVS